MGSVFRAIDRERRQPAAIKVVRSSEGDVVERFAREARILEQLAHPTIVGHLAPRQDRRRCAVPGDGVVEGEDLAARLDAGRLGIADALAVAHARGAVHRDIKPSNVFLVGGRPEQAKLLDWSRCASRRETSRSPAARRAA